MTFASADTPEIPEEVRKFLTNAKRHHYVAEFHQRRFSSAPGEDHPQIYQMDVRSGRTRRTSTLNNCVIQHYNTLYEVKSLPKGFVEATFSAIEAAASVVIEKLVARRPLSQQEELSLALYVHMQQQRTPRGREALNFVLEQAGKYWLLKGMYEQPHLGIPALEREIGRLPTDDELTTYVRTLAARFENGELGVQPSRDQEVAAMFANVETGVAVILAMCWELTEALEGEEFILCDEPILRFDPSNPGGSTGWLSSPTVTVTVPLDPSLLLFLKHLPRGGRRRVVASRQKMTEFNLRTYASAREVILGSNQRLLQSVRVAAKASATAIAKYRQQPPSFHMIETAVGDTGPPTVTTTKGPSTVKIRRGPRPK